MSQHKPTGPNLPKWLLGNRNFILLWAAYGISAFGDHLSEMALLKESGGLDRPDITRVQALMTFAFFLPFVLLGPLAGWWADRYNRRGTMILSDLARAAVVFSIPFVLSLAVVERILFTPNHPWKDYIVALPLLLTGTFATFFSPARQALLPTLIRDNQLVRANAMISALGTIGAILSAIVGGMLVDWAGAGHLHLNWNYWLDAFTFLLSGALVTGILLSRSRYVPQPIAPGVLTPLREGFAYVWAHRRVLQMILLGTVFWAAAGVIISVVPALVRDVFGGTYTDAGMYRGLIAAGLAIGSALLTIVGHTAPLRLIVLFSVAGGAFWVAALDTAVIFKFSPAFTALCLLMIGVHGSGILVPVMVVIQRLVPDSRRGRVFGVSDMTTMGAMVLATAALGLPHIPELDSLIPYLLAIVALGLVMATLVAYRIYRRADDPQLPALTSFIWDVLVLYARLWCRVQRVGPCTVPRQGPVILAANHTAGIDPVAILATCRHRMTSFIVEQKYYRVPVAHFLMRLAHCIPVDRERPGKSFMTAALRALKDGRCLAIFPQGTYEPPDQPEPEPKTGIATLALRTGATVIPCHISGTHYTYHPLKAYFFRHRIRIRYGKPVNLSEFQERGKEPGVAEEVTERIWAEIKALAPDDAA